MKIMIIALSTLFILGAAGVLFLNQAKFGRIPQGDRLERVKQSPHYDGQKFVNDEKTVMMTGDKNLFETTLEFLFGKKSQTVPDTALTVVKTDLKMLPADKDWIVWFGHSSYLMNLSGKKILVDPVFYQGSPVSFVNKMFKGTTGLGVGEHFEYWGYPVEKLVELDWWDSTDLGEGFNVTSTPARHFSGRGIRSNKTLWSSFVFKTPKRSVWIGGDSGYGKHFKKIGEKFADIDLAILENGQYNEDWNQIHALPEQLSKEMLDLNANRYMTVHHSKFCLAYHTYFEPLENAKRAAQESGKPVLMPQMGEVVYLE